MKRIKSFGFLIFLAIVVFALSSSVPIPKSSDEAKNSAPEANISSMNSLTVGEIVTLSASDFAKLRGAKLSFKEKAIFRFIKRELRNELKNESIKADTKINLNQTISEELPKFNLGGFLLGLLLGLIGVALAHIFSNKKEVRRSSWYGFGTWLIILVIISVL